MSPLRPPTLPFASPSGSPLSSRRSSTTPLTAGDPPAIPRSDSVSLSTHYLPAKYTALHEPGNYAHRRNSHFSYRNSVDASSVRSVPGIRSESPAPSRGSGARLTRFFPSSLALAHKTVPRGGGQGAFASDASRMGGEAEKGDEVVEHVGEGMRQRRGYGARENESDVGEDQRLRFSEREQGPGVRAKKPGKLVWNRFKWCIFAANALLLFYAIGILIVALLVWFDVFYRSDVIRVGNRTELIISTAAGALSLFTALLGFAGIILNNRAFLAVYNLLLWVCLALIVTPGYLTYKQHTFNLEGKINAQWSRSLGLSGRLRIQNQLDCCGYFSPFIEATTSNTCYARSTLPGCKSRYLKFERKVLKNWYIAAFAIVPAHLAIIVTALLCANHVTYRFGKGLMPKRYRLDAASMAVIMDEYAGQIAQRYGQDVAREALHRSTSDLQLKEKGRAYSFTYPASIATSETHDPGLLNVNTLSMR
ncbi:hypothetical protein NliqN6_5851 [Naganishia liquefaciens]|uniref:Tetraspanin family protein n=1 Tax=Naganishia liquefaciens TaxID=104408 RepID=A0A8H3U0C3_9TREE|nr:hypothetical protein NliqN6_5851 [Naganishia liquefaciens]